MRSLIGVSVVPAPWKGMLEWCHRCRREHASWWHNPHSPKLHPPHKSPNPHPSLWSFSVYAARMSNKSITPLYPALLQFQSWVWVDKAALVQEQREVNRKHMGETTPLQFAVLITENIGSFIRNAPQLRGKLVVRSTSAAESVKVFVTKLAILREIHFHMNYLILHEILNVSSQIMSRSNYIYIPFLTIYIIDHKYVCLLFFKD